MDVADELAEKLAAELAALRQRKDGGQLCVYVPGHPLARKTGRSQGWAVAARWVLHERWARTGVDMPRCEGECLRDGVGRRIAFARRRTQRTGTLPAAVVWPLDGDPENLDARNLMGVCAPCAQADIMSGRIERDPDGRFRRRNTKPT